MEETIKISYSDAVEELDAILKELENSDQVNMDTISSSVKRAAFLMEVCRKQLHEMEMELQKIVEDL
ncbi:MAG: exodeoxyribonuclease VII small subunit [Paludibacter sp.]|jgi:exodeoxyribonuclease VII small subunit|nr:exodeoxyribonuclease VII small subunit [Paludibacter sp.]